MKWKKEVLEFLKFVIIAFVIVVPIRIFIAQPFIVSGSSMVPTFHNGEYLIIDELSYYLGDPVRGDVSIFHYPNNKKIYFIKRIIGLPGETVTIKNGKVTIINEENPNGFTLDEPYIKETFNTTSTYKLQQDEYFVMGDNRNFSSDSRVWGVLPRKLLVGRAFVRLFPFDSIEHLPGSIIKYTDGK